jgi:hypothetical protein
LIATRSFFIKHGLVDSKRGDEEGRIYYLDDFSYEGLEMIRRGAEGWADSIAAIKDPPDFEKLDRMLEDLRRERR